jgi:hypothetical protein
VLLTLGGHSIRLAKERTPRFSWDRDAGEVSRAAARTTATSIDREGIDREGIDREGNLNGHPTETRL